MLVLLDAYLAIVVREDLWNELPPLPLTFAWAERTEADQILRRHADNADIG